MAKINEQDHHVFVYFGAEHKACAMNLLSKRSLSVPGHRSLQKLVQAMAGAVQDFHASAIYFRQLNQIRIYAVLYSSIL